MYIFLYKRAPTNLHIYFFKKSLSYTSPSISRVICFFRQWLLFDWRERIIDQRICYLTKKYIQWIENIYNEYKCIQISLKGIQTPNQLINICRIIGESQYVETPTIHQNIFMILIIRPFLLLASFFFDSITLKSHIV